MTKFRWLSGSLIVAAMIAAAFANTPHRAATTAEGYYILAADFHVHSFPGDWATLAPWDEFLEARRAHLDVIALTSHNHIWAGKLGLWIAHALDGPIVLAGEEIVGPLPHYHMLAVGIHSTVDWRKSAEDAIDDIHAQGGVAIAAHPVAEYWPSYDFSALQRLDGAEVLHPAAYESDRWASELREFYSRGAFAAVGDSDYRGLGAAGICRTYVFARERNEKGVLDAIRARHTVVYDRGRYYGDSQLIQLMQQAHPAPALDDAVGNAGWLLSLRRIAGGIGLMLAVILGPGAVHLRRQQ